jgi:phosphopantothenoylcysteine synthetase/decarboxylase
VLCRAANGLAGHLLTSAPLAHDRPVICFPSMNERMWQQPSVRRNVELLRGDGHQVADPVRAQGWEVASACCRGCRRLPW